jgi:hypothetical protein
MGPPHAATSTIQTAKRMPERYQIAEFRRRFAR